MKKYAMKSSVESKYSLTVLTLRDVGELMGMTGERIRQIEEGALRKLRLRLSESMRLDPAMRYDRDEIRFGRAS